MKMRPKRPPAVTLSGWLIILIALFNLGIATYFYFLRDDKNLTTPIKLLFSSRFTLQDNETLFLIPGLAINLIVLICAIALLRVKRWAWIALVILVGLGLLINLLRYFLVTPDYIYLLAYTLLAFLLNQSEVQKALGVRRVKDEQPL